MYPPLVASRPSLSSLLALAAVLGASCVGADGDDGGGDGGDFPGTWQYQEGSFSFVNCTFSSTTVELTRSGFVIGDEDGTLVRTNPDGCRFTIVPTTARHARGVPGEGCTVDGTDALGNPMTTVYTLESLLLELKPDDASQMIEVFFLASEQTSALGTIDCEISGDNTLDRAP
ncbi:MAG: hypothetical protein JXB39_01335 [Deltaproteobacteria bacterium]|nr:hypothetical protein [Deltaproteobacteria bacterium]